MRNEDFLEMLGNIDDCTIDECTAVPVTVKKHRYIKNILAFAAVFLLTVCAVSIGRLLPEGLLTGEEHSLSEGYTQESTSYTENTTYESQITEPFVTEEISSSEAVTDSETTAPFVPESTTAEITLPPEETTEEQPSTENNESVFVEVPYSSLIFSETDGFPDDYSGKKKVTWMELLYIYGTVIIPSAIGELFSDSGDNHIVSTDGEKNSFRFTLTDDSVLTVNVSKPPIPLRPVEEENMDSVTEIEGTSVLLLKGYDDGDETAFTAYFKNKGVYFRITQLGKNLSEEKFVKIIKSLI